MRTLGDIIESVKSGERPEYDELRYSLLALEFLLSMGNKALRRLADVETRAAEPKPKLLNSAVFQHEEMFNRIKVALARDPKAYVGPENDPDKPAYQERRRASLRLVDRILRKQSKP